MARVRKQKKTQIRLRFSPQISAPRSAVTHNIWRSMNKNLDKLWPPISPSKQGKQFFGSLGGGHICEAAGPKKGCWREIPEKCWEDCREQCWEKGECREQCRTQATALLPALLPALPFFLALVPAVLPALFRDKYALHVGAGASKRVPTHGMSRGPGHCRSPMGHLRVKVQDDRALSSWNTVEIKN